MKTSLDTADIVRRFSKDYITQFGDVMLPSQKKAIFDIATCQTVARGGRLLRCDDCDHSFWIWHGCRNRACSERFSQSQVLRPVASVEAGVADGGSRVADLQKTDGKRDASVDK